jgi:hypothetical protein
MLDCCVLETYSSSVTHTQYHSTPFPLHPQLAQLIQTQSQIRIILGSLTISICHGLYLPLGDAFSFGWTYAGPSIGKFWQLFTSLNITSRAELDQLFQRHFRHPKGKRAAPHIIYRRYKNYFYNFLMFYNMCTWRVFCLYKPLAV